MEHQQLELQIHETFPIAQSMGMKIRALSSTRSELFFPLAPNRNNIGTAFGGSLYSAAILACYALYRKLLSDNGITEGRFLNRKAEMEYALPTTKDFVAAAEIEAPPNEVARFIDAMRRRGISQLPMKADILIDQTPVAHFKAFFIMTPLQG